VTEPVLDLRVERPVAGGAMLARHDGRVVLVQGAIPGERVRVRVDRERRDVIHATVIDVVEPAPDRRFVEGDSTCGGQVYRHIAYERQRRLKSEVIDDALRRIAHVQGLGLTQVVPSAQRGYRMRARLHVGATGLGFLREGTHVVCDPAQTWQLLPETDRVVAELGRRLVRAKDRSVFYVDIAENIEANQRVLHIRLRHDRALETVAAWTAGCEFSGVAYSMRGKDTTHVVSGRPIVSDHVAVLAGGADAGENRLQRHARSFFQGNRYLLPSLVSAVCRRITVGPVMDLYAGVGLFAVGLASRGLEAITAVEQDASARVDLVANTTGVWPQIGVVGTSVEDFLVRRSGQIQGTVIVDPPRVGLSRTVVERLSERGVSRLVYVSCDVATFARDVRRFREVGYTIEDIEAFDMFPNTAHIELLATFCR
jgi:23S rRNA (uracil1939-C5)-methyltransferase